MEIELKVLETFDFGVIYPNGIVGCEEINIAFSGRTITALIGPSGCGKSSFLRGLSRLSDEFGCRYRGSVVLSDGTNVTGLDPYDLRQLRLERVGFVQQTPIPFFGKTIIDDITLPLQAQGIRDRDFLYDRAKTILKRVALWDEVSDRLNTLSVNLSGGQQQRMCIGRAIINMPEILLLDEPCSSIDPKSTQIIEGLLIDLATEYSIIIVTHNMQQAQRIAERTAFFYEGRLIEYDFTSTIFNKPSSSLTADYIMGKFS